MFAPLGWVSRSLQKEMYSLFRDSSLFDSGWYKSQLRGFAKLQDPVWHYIYIGWLRGLSPSRLFDPDYYTAKYGDLRRARVNPLHHYLTYGRDEGRLPLRSSQEVIDYYLPEAAALRTFVTPSLGSKRLSILLDSSSTDSSGMNSWELISLCGRIAVAQKATLRILTRGLSLESGEVERATDEFDKKFHRQLEITPIPTAQSYSDIPLFEDEITIASSWSGAQALRFAKKTENSWCLVEKPAPESITGDTVAPENELAIFSGVRIVKNTAPLREWLRASQLLWPQYVPADVIDAIGPTKRPGRIWKLGVYCQPNSFPSAFGRGLEALTSWLLSAPAQAEQIHVVFFGESPVPVQMGAEFTPEIVALSSHGIELDAVVLLSTAPKETSLALADKGVDVMCVSPKTNGVRVRNQSGITVSASMSPGDIGEGLALLHQRFRAREELLS